MDLPNRNQIAQTCQKHNKPIVYQDFNIYKGVSCSVCLQNMTGIVYSDEVQQYNQDLYNKQKIKIDQDKQKFQKILEAILNWEKNINSSLDKIMKLLMDGIETIDKFFKQQELTKSNLNLLINNSENWVQGFENQQLNSLNIKSLAKQQLQDFHQKYCNIDQLLIILDDINSDVQLEKDLRKTQYELIKDSKTIQTEICRVIAFNKEGNILLVGSEKNIIIYRFLKGEIIKEIQRLTDHDGEVYCLQFMKKSNSFVSGSDDNSIIKQKILLKYAFMRMSKSSLINLNKYKFKAVKNVIGSFQFNLQKIFKILTVKHGQFLNIFKVNDDGDINLMQTIQFQTHILYGVLNDDARYIATWYIGQKEIQIRHLIYNK